MKRNVLLLGAVALVLVCCIIAAGCTSSSTTTVKNDALNIIGISEDGVEKYLGIPYAEPPVGDLRFAPPVAKEPVWTETLDCTQYRNASVQQTFLISDDMPRDEDCLYLNIWKPADAKEGDNLPVFFWIHGGGWCYDTGADVIYEGSEFAKDGIVVVTINYRLGTLGYLALDTLMDEYGTAGSWATLDQICALQWVHDNIAKFGGNPDDITIGGESAGSFNTFALLLSPQAEGLFQKATLESGALTYINANQMRLDKAIDIGKQIAAQFGADDSEEGLAKLRQADALDLWNATSINLLNITEDNPYSTYPVYDGVVLPLNDPLKAIAEGKYNKNVTLLMGNNCVEGLAFVHDYMVSEDKLNNYIKKVFREDSYQEVIDYYAAQTDRSLHDKMNEVVGMTVITMGVVAGEDAYENNGAKMYVYEFNYTDSEGGMQTHAVEMPFVFGQDTLLNGDPMEGDDLLIRDATHAYWVNFIKTGNPNGGALMEWPEYVKDTQTILEIDATPSLINRSHQDALDFLLPRYIR